MIYTVKDLSIINEVEVFLEFFFFFCDPADVGNLISGSSAFLNVEFQASFFTLLLHLHQEALYFNFTFCPKGGVICISEVIDISPTCTSFKWAFCMMYSAYKLNKQGDNIQP